ncbi:major facilitator superfamily domain-containing protein [Xylaria arbuscula]|nr:major facilitator superfamily domain-containing protein [Xylaria arbuscula]
MPTVITNRKASEKPYDDETEGGIDKEDNNYSIPPLGKPQEEKRFWFQRGKRYDPNAIATQPSVYDDPSIRGQYEPRADWENAHRFDPSARWTWGEEHKVIRRIDWRIMLWAATMFTAMELDRSNLGQALADNFLEDMNLSTNDYNLGNSVYALSFLAGEFPSQLLAKWIGPDRYIPVQILLFSVVSASQFAMNSKASFLACRSLLALLQGGFIPEVVLYLSYFYKHHELTIRLSFFWTGMFTADILSSLIAFGLLHLRGVHGYPGWRWLFLIEGLITGTIGILSFVMLPPGPTQTASWSRGKDGWFTAREESIMVNRIIRDDPSKGTMHNREPITLKLLWQSLTDIDLWPLYAIGLTFNIPTFPGQLYLTLSLKGLGFTTFQTNLLTIPYLVLRIINMLLLSVLAEITGQLAASASLFQFWCLPFLIYLRVVDTANASKWLTWAIISLLLAAPLAHPVQVGWISRNANTVRSRAVGAALYNMFLQAGVVISSNIYRADGGPLYRRGNSILLGILGLNLVLYTVAKIYYIWRNRSRARKWDHMTPEERLVYLSDHQDKGNKRLDFRLAS